MACSERERSYDAHIEYLRTIKDRIRFAGPLATADGANGRGDEHLVGSLFVLDEPPSVSFELMQKDPYVQSGVWDRLSVYQGLKGQGPWISGVTSKPWGSLYATLASTAAPALMDESVVLFAAELEPRQMWPDERAAPVWRAVAIFSARSLQAARALLVRDTADPARQIETWSVPIMVGTWTRPAKTT